VARRISGSTDLTLDTLARLPANARGCVYWELDPASAARATRAGHGALEKEAWLSKTLLEWGTCGQLVWANGDVAGFAIYAPPAYVPRAGGFPTSPTGSDAVTLMAVAVAPQYRGRGVGRTLIQGVARDLVRRAASGSADSVRAIEAFAIARARVRSGEHVCVLPAGFLTALGFATVRSHPTYPRMRLDLRTTAGWRADVGQAWHRLRTTVAPPAVANSVSQRS
jgi:GNAT superfamily N-acetyltransferase